MLAAADALQFAWDGDKLKDGETAERKLSKFTSWIVDGLGRGEAAPNDEQITMDALFRYVSRRARADGSPAVPQRYVDRDTGDLVIARNPAAVGPAWQDLMRQLEDVDWSVRAQAVEAVGRLLSRQGPVGRAAQGALDERLTSERDFKVRNRIMELLGVAREKPEVTWVALRSASSPVEHGSLEHGSVVAFELNDREKAVLMSLGVMRERWTTLPPPVIERVRLYVKALRNTRWLYWSVAALLLMDVGTISNMHDRSMSGIEAFTLLGLQLVVAVICLVSFKVSRKPIEPVEVAEFEAVMRGYEVVTLLGGRLYISLRFWQSCSLCLAGGMFSVVYLLSVI